MSRGRDPAACTVVGLPTRVSREDHAKAATEIEERLASLDSVIAVYRTGSVTAPGISDIDRLAVLERPASIRDLWEGLSSRTREIAMHAPFALDRPTFERHRLFAHLEPLELVVGERLPAEQPALPGYVSTLIGVEGLMIGLLKLVKQLTIGRLKARALMCETHALAHSLRLASLPVDAAPGAHRLVQDVDQLRRSWFERSAGADASAIRELAVDGRLALLEALSGLHPPPGRSGERLVSLPMAPPWGNVTLAAQPAEAASDAQAHAGWTPRFSSWSSRVAETCWRLPRRRVPVPPTALAWLLPPTNGEAARLRTERDRLVRRYSGFVDACGGIWSSIGFAGAFLPR